MRGWHVQFQQTPSRHRGTAARRRGRVDAVKVNIRANLFWEGCQIANASGAPVQELGFILLGMFISSRRFVLRGHGLTYLKVVLNDDRDLGNGTS